MFSFAHLAIIFLIALLVFGPEKLPEVARQIGKALGDFRRASTDFRRVIEQEFAEIERQAREKEEQARRKALETPTPSAAAAQAAPATAGPPTGSPPDGTVPNTSAQDSGHSSRENQAAPADVHPA